MLSCHQGCNCCVVNILWLCTRLHIAMHTHCTRCALLQCCDAYGMCVQVRLANHQLMHRHHRLLQDRMLQLHQHELLLHPRVKCTVVLLHKVCMTCAQICMIVRMRL